MRHPSSGYHFALEFNLDGLTDSQRFHDLHPYKQYRWKSEDFWCNTQLARFYGLKLEVTESPDVRPWNGRLE
ncbi:hypothetical protein E8E11_002660 [Didymella keratinophila]|nr:hypothetical protein E8E11_002660 [Didymella keratinophila]